MGTLDRDRGEWVVGVVRSGGPPLPPLEVTVEERSDGVDWVWAESETVPDTGGAA